MIFLVTGGAGFIGSALVRRLLKDKKNTVINVDNLSYSGNLESIPSSNKNNNYTFENCDITNKENITDLVMKYEPNIIFHLAAESHVDRSIDGPEKFILTNLIGTFNLLEASRDFFKHGCSKSGFNFKFHHISTDEVYGDLETTEAPFDEDSRYKPSSPYAASKAGSDHLVRSWGRTFDIPYVMTNCSNNYGPYQFPEKLIPHTIINALCGEELPVYGNGKQIRDWLHVEDHISALLKVSQSKKINDTYVIGGNSEMKNIEVIKSICIYLDNKISKKPNNISSFSELISYVEDRPGHDRRYAINSSKINSELSWAPKVNFDEGIKQTIDWYIDNRIWWERVLSGEYRLTRVGLNNDK